MLRSLPFSVSEDVLLGCGDDASVVRVTDDYAIVQTIDYISPVVNDPYEFGRVAAANALSDIYAMGATPSFAQNLVGFPVNTLPIGYLVEILRGGADMMKTAGVPIVGGHTYEDHAPKYGLTVTGSVHPDRFVATRTGEADDVLILTKPLGIGVITTAIDRGLASAELERRVIEVMTTLNDRAAQAMVSVGVHACTDVSGFGLLGHLYEMVKDRNLSAELDYSAIPVIAGARHLICEETLSTGTRNNMLLLHDKVDWNERISESDRWVLYDAQTSGGLLLSVSEDKKSRLMQTLADMGCDAAAIGRLRHRQTGDKQFIVGS